MPNCRKLQRRQPQDAVAATKVTCLKPIFSKFWVLLVANVTRSGQPDVVLQQDLQLYRSGGEQERVNDQRLFNAGHQDT